MSISLRCECGETFHADPAHAGRTIRCRCGRTMVIPAATPVATPRRSGRRRRTWKWPRLRWPTLRVSPRIARILGIASWGYLAMALAAAGLLWLLGDRWWLATVLLFGPRWPLLLPALPLFLAAAAIRPRLLAPVAVAALVSLGPVMGWNSGWRRFFIPNQPRSVRLITFNAAGGNNPLAARIPQGLSPFDADILVFQECPPILAEPASWPSGWTARAEGSICLASRWRLVSVKTEDRVLTGNQGGTGTLVLFRLAAPGDSIDVAVVHLETPRKGLERLRYGMDLGSVALNTMVRDVGSERAGRWIASHSPDPIIAGDFNLPVESWIFRNHWSRCPDAFSAAGRGFGYTRVLPKFSIRIDHVLACPGWRAQSTAIGPALGSDHLPLIVDLARRR